MDYIPFKYLECIKRPGERYFIKVIIADDLLCVFLASSLLNPHAPLHALSMTFLMLSFWCVYETGYLENDMIAYQSEKEPVLSDSFSLWYQHRRLSTLSPWLWALAFASIGIFLLQTFDGSDHGSWQHNFPFLVVVRNMLIWCCFLIIVRVTFFLYNRIDKTTRVWVYPFLQAYKCFGFLILTTTNLIGTILFIAQVISRWIPYIVYRYAKVDWKDDLVQPLRFFLLIFLMGSFAISNRGISFFLNWQMFWVLLWCLVRGNRALRHTLEHVTTVSVDEWRKNTRR